MTVLAFLGTGAMGAPMARNAARAGLTVRAWNRTRAKAEPLAALGVEVPGTAAEATEGADVVVTMLSDGPATLAAVDGALRQGQVWAQMGTVGVAWTDRLAELAAQAGVAFVDAPVLGSLPAAESGDLVVLASGPDGAIDRISAFFGAVGRETKRLGAAGNGTRVKLVFNYWALGLTALTGEVVALADALGPGGARFLELIEGGFADAPYAQLKGKKMVSGDLSPMFRLALGHKDVGLALEAGAAAALELTVAEAVLEEMGRAIARGYGDSDTAAVIEATRPGSA